MQLSGPPRPTESEILGGRGGGCPPSALCHALPGIPRHILEALLELLALAPSPLDHLPLSLSCWIPPGSVMASFPVLHPFFN